MLAKGQLPNVIDHQALRTNEVFRRVHLNQVWVSIDSDWILLKAAAPAIGGLNLQAVRNLFPHCHLEAVKFVVVIGL